VTGLRPGASAPEHEPVAGTEEIHLLERVRSTAVVLLAELARSPERLRIQARDVVMELDWPAPAPGTPAPDAAGDRAPPPDAAGDHAPAGPRITAPTVGTFYRRPEPGSDPFVEVGDQVKPGQQVAIVEAMKLMLPVEADTEAVIAEVLADDGQPVEYGQALFTLGPVTLGPVALGPGT
jgi:acetyl-CoA carboxylase biotin carboxyl carrier protein